MNRSILFPLALFLLSASASAQQQAASWHEFGLDIGVAAPVGQVATHRHAGPALTFSLGYRTTQRGLGLRGELAWSRLAGGPPPPEAFSSSLHEDYDTYSLRGSVVYTFSNRPFSVYGLIGAGNYSLVIRNDTNPYGSVGGLHLGLGLRVPAGSLQVNVESQMVALLTDYGAGEFNFPVLYFPLTVGIRF